MPRTYVAKGILQMDRTDLQKAFYYCLESGCSIREAARKYNIKRTTLQDAFKRSRTKSDGQTFVLLMEKVNRVFSSEQENKIVDYAIKIARMFYGLPVVEFLKLIYTYAIAVGSKVIPVAWEREQSATRDWYYGFMKRHPTLTLKTPEGMSIARITAFNKTNVSLFFNVYIEAMDKYNFSPDRIFNLDESSLTTVMKPVKVLCEKGKPVASQISRERGASMTFVGIINAAGSFIPPVFIIPRKRWNDSFMRGTIHGSKGLLHQNGWMNGELFLETLQHIQRKTYCSPDNKILLIMDNAECYMNIHAVEYAIANGIVIVTLPPHTTARLQPLDVSIFGPFKSHMKVLQKDFHLTNPNKLLTEHQLPELACKAWIKACTPANVMSGFAATGIWPIERNIFPDDAFAGAEVTEQPPPDTDAEEQGLLLDLQAMPPSPNSSVSLSAPDVDASRPSGMAAPGPSGMAAPGPSGMASPGPSGMASPGPSGMASPGPSGMASPGPSGMASPGPSGFVTPGPSGITHVRSAPIISTPLSSASSTSDLSPEAIRPYPKAAARPLAKGRKRVKACILTENVEAISDLQAKEEKKLHTIEKKRQAEEKKKTRVSKTTPPQEKRRKTQRRIELEVEEECEEETVPLILDDSSEYSEEEVEELSNTIGQAYPFQEKELEVEDFILVALPIEEGPQEGKFVHFVGRILGIGEDDSHLSVSFLRIKSPFCRDTFSFPIIEDVTDVTREQCLGVLATVKKSTQRMARSVKVFPPLYGFDLR